MSTSATVTPGFRRPAANVQPDFRCAGACAGDRHRHDHLGARLRRKPQPGRCDADDLTELLSQPYATADDLGIRAELRLPELVTEHHHRRRPGPRVTFLEHAAVNGLSAQHLEQPRRRDERRHAKRIADVEDGAVEVAESVQTLEHVLARGEIDEVSDRDELLRHARALIAMIENHDVVSVRIRQRAQHHRFEHGKHGNVGAHPERQREHGGRHEPGLAIQKTQGMAKVVEEHRQRLHWCAREGTDRETIVGSVGERH